MKKITNLVLWVDAAVAGASGDMVVSALLGLLSESDRIKVLENILTKFSKVSEGVTIDLKKVNSHGFSGYQLMLTGLEKRQTVQELSNNLVEFSTNLREKYRSFGQEALDLLVSSEKDVHGVETKHLHLHELGTLDTLFDIYSTAYLLDFLSVQFVGFSPINVGSGRVKTSHGVVPVPSPVTLKILEGVPLQTVPSIVSGEFLTPTGASIIRSLFQNFKSVNQVIWTGSALGFGVKEFENFSNFLRLRIGYLAQTPSEIAVIETHLDDISGEFLGHSFESLATAGALDVSYYPLIMKKNRPGWCLRVLTKIQDVDKVSELVMRETGTLGVRITTAFRHISGRKVESVVDMNPQIRIKRGLYSKKYEFEDLQNAAKHLGITPLELQQRLSFDQAIEKIESNKEKTKKQDIVKDGGRE